MKKEYPSRPVMLIDDEERILKSFSTALKLNGILNIATCSDSRKALDIIRNNGAEVILLDLIMPHIRGEELLQSILDFDPDIPVVVVTGNTDVESAVHCMKLGAYDYLLKPVDSQRLYTSVINALKMREKTREIEALRGKILSPELEHPEVFSRIITRNPVMNSLFNYIEAIAGTSTPVLITGETGVGKELFARAIHDASGRKGAFVAVTVAGLDESVFSDTIFGHKKGAYTGADSQRKGLISEADGGTLFLDEIGDLKEQSQIKLLRLLQENEYMPLGEDRAVRSNARIVCATNRELLPMMEEGSFRSDLYYRLCAHCVNIPPLRERKEDIPALLENVMAQCAAELGKKKPTYPQELISLLNNYAFPGNVRELRAMVMKALSQHKSMMLSMEVFKEHVFSEGGTRRLSRMAASQESAMFGDKLPSFKDVKRLLAEEALSRANGNKTLAAEMLGVTRKTISAYLGGEEAD